ncbi:MAG: endonuclease MutS2 [Christensenellales bacterium]
MSTMQDKALRVLEFTKIREQLAAFAMTESGEALCLALLPHATLSEAVQAQEETQEALIVLTFRGDHPLMAFKDVRDSLNLAQKGATLSPRTLLDIADVLRAASTARIALVTDKENTPILKGLAAMLVTNAPLERKIKDAIISEEEIADNASSELADIRRHMRLCNERVKEKLRSMIQSANFSRYLQEPIVTLRNGRYVIPVRQEYRQYVPGLVHDQSSSGATLFIEPLSVVEAGNELKGWALKEQAEIERILSDFSAQVAQNGDAIAADVDIMAQLDFIFAKGELARDMNAIAPKMNDRGLLSFVRVRHPLIDRAAVVPCDLRLGDDFTTLIITGPNTGGKTVTLKTVGLICLMAQAGLHIPGNLGTQTSVFHQVYADIGDEQSIEQSLSTFSSHMTNIVRILEEVQPDDLVLFDELGAGTDPTEGAALGQAILSVLKTMQVRTVATTHYSELKAYALSTQGVENASVEFDVATLRPTYRLSIGVPGKSNAFEISQRLGLPGKVIVAARELLSHETIKFEDVIANAEYHRQVAEKERQLAQETHQETIRLRGEAEALYESIASGRALAEKKAKEDARRILERTKRESAAIIEELKLLKRSGGDISGSLSGLQKRMQDLGDTLAEGLQPNALLGSAAPESLSVGIAVDIPHLNAVGTVLSLPDAKGDVMIQAGILKMKLQANQLRLRATAPIKKSTVNAKTDSTQRSVKMECDVRGLALDEALLEVDRYLDMALLAGMHEVWIIHGKGTGVLRAGIQQHLKSVSQVKSFRLGNYGEGESGVSVVELK